MKSFWNKSKPFIITGLIAIAAITVYGFITNRFAWGQKIGNFTGKITSGKFPGEA